MTDIMQVVGGVLLICIPVSLIMSIAYTGEHHCGNVKALFYFWFLVYLCLLVFAAVGFAGIAGVAMLTGAFQ